MAEVFKRITGVPIGGRHGKYRDPLNFVASHYIETRAKVDELTEAHGRKADSLMSTHHESGRAKIVTERHDVDAFVVLDDSASGDKAAAAAIERGGRGGRGGVHALSRAFPGAVKGRRAQ